MNVYSMVGSDDSQDWKRCHIYGEHNVEDQEWLELQIRREIYEAS